MADLGKQERCRGGDTVDDAKLNGISVVVLRSIRIYIRKRSNKNSSAIVTVELFLGFIHEFIRSSKLRIIH